MLTSLADPRVRPAGCLVSRAWRTSQLCKLMAPKHSWGRSESTCKVSELRKMSHYANQPGRSPGEAAGCLVSRAWHASQLCKLMAPKHSRGRSGPHAKFRSCAKCHTMLTSLADPQVRPAGCLVSQAWRASQLCKLMAPKHSWGRSESTCKVSELRKMSHYANQPGRSPGAAGWLPR